MGLLLSSNRVGRSDNTIPKPKYPVVTKDNNYVDAIAELSLVEPSVDYSSMPVPNSDCQQHNFVKSNREISNSIVGDTNRIKSTDVRRTIFSKKATSPSQNLVHDQGSLHALLPPSCHAYSKNSEIFNPAIIGSNEDGTVKKSRSIPFPGRGRGRNSPEHQYLKNVSSAISSGTVTDTEDDDDYRDIEEDHIKRMYDLRTWAMYARIIEYRARRIREYQRMQPRVQKVRSANRVRDDCGGLSTANEGDWNKTTPQTCLEETENPIFIGELYFQQQSMTADNRPLHVISMAGPGSIQSFILLPTYVIDDNNNSQPGYEDDMIFAID